MASKRKKTPSSATSRTGTPHSARTRAITITRTVPESVPIYLRLAKLLRMSQVARSTRLYQRGPLVRKTISIIPPRRPSVGAVTISNRGVTVATKRRAKFLSDGPALIDREDRAPVLTGTSSWTASKAGPSLRRRFRSLDEQHRQRKDEKKWTRRLSPE